MDDRRFQKAAKALSDPRRFCILQAIAQNRAGRVYSGELRAAARVTQATVSHHLKELAQADLVIAASEGQFRYFSPNYETIDEYLAELKSRLKSEKE